MIHIYYDSIIIFSNPPSTATKDNIKGIAKYLNGIYQYVSYEILNYNPLAEAKYHLVDREYCFEENHKLYTKEQMQEFRSWAVEGGLDDQEFKIAKIASDFLGKQLEA